jgi:hypothetical protein
MASNNIQTNQQVEQRGFSSWMTMMMENNISKGLCLAALVFSLRCFTFCEGVSTTPDSRLLLSERNLISGKLATHAIRSRSGAYLWERDNWAGSVINTCKLMEELTGNSHGPVMDNHIKGCPLDKCMSYGTV